MILLIVDTSATRIYQQPVQDAACLSFNLKVKVKDPAQLHEDTRHTGEKGVAYYVIA
jgi:hypothetical protein